MAKRVAMQIRVPEPLKAWVESQVRRGRYRDAGHFFEQAAQRSLATGTRAQVEARLLEALDGPAAAPLRRSETRAIQSRLRRRFGGEGSARKSA